ncbi:MAG TPA: TetR/AcrR family transcriptional regulator [Acidimicrobiia bacterium]|nr:TetR/AcrR family transcriptional regulator [Acidimicrobiia bacterium]
MTTEAAETPRERVFGGAYECVERFGLGKTTIEDVARASGVSRATIYRLFPGGRDQLLRETVGWEMNRFFARLAEAVADLPDLASRLELALVFARQSVLDHAVLQKVLVTEPEVLLPLMTIEQHRVVRYITAYLVPLLGAERAVGRLDPVVDLNQAADHLSRMVLSLISSPGRWDLSDPDSVRRLVHQELLGGLLVASDRAVARPHGEGRV